MLLRVLDWDFALSKHLQVSMSEIPADEWLGMRILDAERDAYRKELELLNPHG